MPANRRPLASWVPSEPDPEPVRDTGRPDPVSRQPLPPPWLNAPTPPADFYRCLYSGAGMSLAHFATRKRDV